MIRDNHEAIIPEEIFDAIQNEKERRSSKVGNIKRRHWNSTNTNKKVVWQCRGYIKKGKDFCNMKEVDEEVLEQAFVEVFNEIKLNKEDILGTVADNIAKILKNQTEAQQIEKLETEIQILKEQLKSLLQLKTKEQLDAEVFNEEYTRISEELTALRQRKGKFEENEDV